MDNLLLEAWVKFYTAAIRSGKSANKAEAIADKGVKTLRKKSQAPTGDKS